MDLPSLVVFGPQITTWPASEYLSQLRTTLLNEPLLSSFVSAIRDLPDLWETLVKWKPSLFSVPGLQAIQIIQQWIDGGELSWTQDVLPNVLFTPMTVIIQIIQYFQHMQGGNSHHALMLKDLEIGGIQGFCTGFLTALAVASSVNEKSIAVNAGVALRLAMCIGAMVDLDGSFGSSPNLTTCLAVRWKTELGSKDNLLHILKDYPGAYISVITDATSVTITVPAFTESALANHLSREGLSVQSIGLQGRFHNPALDKSLQEIIDLCKSHPNLHFPAAETLFVPVRSNVDSQVIRNGQLHEIALTSLLREVSNWHLTISAATSDLVQVESPSALVVGLVNSIPRSIAKASSLSIVRLGPANRSSDYFSTPASTPGTSTPLSTAERRYPEHAVAVVGMACKFPGADSVEEFWDVIKSGTSMAEEVPTSRFSTKNLRRSGDPDTKFWGNFVRDPDAFDHRFFKKSAREAASMDPQQRLLLEVAYEAVASSGYFGETSLEQPNDIGCYIGVCASDYNDNVASHPPTAFSSLGTLRAFLSGKISHYFGWTGPSITYDTACSSSAVAIDAACKAIALGDCSRAIAGGANLFTNPNFYQNLAAASFLSPTGPTKAFDTKADGYCRGEGVGLVMLKSLSQAIADNDPILGVITGSSVNQNSNVTSITVPHGPSQIDLYRKVARMSEIDPLEISFVEAHGTGTPVGDPIECESIRKVFGGAQRREVLHLGSVKGNIGHTEATSGVAALIKSVLMMHYKTIPKQANFTSLNPKIPALEVDRMAVPVTTQSWDSNFRAVCINNYGAAGSNTAMIVCQAPDPKRQTQSPGYGSASVPRYPIFISAATKASLEAYCITLRKYVAHLSSSASSGNILSSLAFNLSHKQNRSLPFFLTGTAATLSELSLLLDGRSPIQQRVGKTQPVVLVFGGQVNTSIGFPEDIYNASARLRYHLDQCDAIVRAAGYSSLFPGIFLEEPMEDIPSLHAMLFSIQYSSAMAWKDSGLEISAVVGHSFGQLTALCVAGSLSLQDGLKLVVGRAVLIQKYWGPERGSMVSLEADINTVSNIISMLGSDHKIEIACYNGPRSHVLVGSASSITAVEQLLVHDSGSLDGIKWKRLVVTHGFHSEFTDPLLPEIKALAKQITFLEPTIPIETCSDGENWTRIDAELIADHTRSPVYFSQAVERITQRLGTCTWLEAGANSSVTNMVRRAIGADVASQHQFQKVQFGSNPVSSLADATLQLWKSGYKIQFWPFHRSQKEEYSLLNLPPYQFEKTRHWLEWVDTAAAPVALTPSVSSPPKELPLFSLVKQETSGAEFAIHPSSKAYKTFVDGHAVLANPLCPAPLYVELVAQAATMLSRPESSSSLPRVDELEIKSPLGNDVDRAISLTMQRVPDRSSTWKFVVASSASGKTGSTTQHATGKVTLRSTNDTALQNEVSRYERLIDCRRCESLVSSPESESMQGALIYKVFAKVVTYAPFYKGVRSISSKGREVTGRVQLPAHNLEELRGTLCNPIAVDNFIQVAGLHVNSLNDIGEDEVFVCTKVETVQPTSLFKEDAEGQSWTVFSSFSECGDKEILNDIFVFDTASKKMVAMILGAHFTRVSIKSLAKVLSRANTAPLPSSSTPVSPSVFKVAAASVPVQRATLVTTTKATVIDVRAPSGQPGSAQILGAVRDLLSKVAEIPLDTIHLESTLEDLGIDSLMVTEVLSEFRQALGVIIPTDDFANLVDIKSLCDYLLAKGVVGHSSLDSESSSTHDLSSGDNSTSIPSASSNSDLSGSVKPGSGDQSGLLEQLRALVCQHLETNSEMTRSTSLADEGLDSLLSIELLSDIEKIFGAKVELDADTTFGDLSDLVIGQQVVQAIPVAAAPLKPITNGIASTNTASATPTPVSASLINPQKSFEQVRYDYEIYAQETGFSKFWSSVYPEQARLVVAYTAEAFATLSSPLGLLKSGDAIPPLRALPKHKLLVAQLYEVLRDAGLISASNGGWVRTSKLLDTTPSSQLIDKIVQAHPQHASEHKLLHLTGARLADCLTGTADPLQLLFRSQVNRHLLADTYTNGPMYMAASKLLGSFLVKAFSAHQGGSGSFHILEIGGGTGGTTNYLIDHLTRNHIPFTYTFTDISPTLVAAAKKKFAGRAYMSFKVLDIEKNPPADFVGQYHTIISTNCVHATRNLPISATNIRKLLRSDGFLSLVEFTRNMFWFDLVFGLLEGWWLFEDGRTHVLADETFWDMSLKAGGFKHVAWTEGETPEANTLRIITGFQSPRDTTIVPKTKKIESFVFKQAGETSLMADVYYPAESQVSPNKRPVALMIHGGGHMMLSRKEVRAKQTQLLLDNGFLPVSVDYRLVPEMNVIKGPMTDVCSALEWARHELPTLKLNCRGLKVDGEKVVVVGWSTGGHLAMSLAWNAKQKNLRPPEAILAFYCPTDLEDDFWKCPNFPENSEAVSKQQYDLLEGVMDEPLTSYTVPKYGSTVGGWMSPSDPRSRIVLHMNWKAQALPIWINGLPTKKAASNSQPESYATMPMPSTEQIVSISPYAQIQRGTYVTPTFIIHGTSDDLIPWQQSQRVHEALRNKGVKTGLAIVDDAPHLFDMYKDKDGRGWSAVQEGYEFLFDTVRQLGQS